MWQRVVAAASQTELRIGGMVACAAVVLTVFLFGMAGFLAAWGGLIDPLRDDPNLFLFQLFKRSATDSAKVQPSHRFSLIDSRLQKQTTPLTWMHTHWQVDSWPAVLVLVLASTMNEGAIDSLQNGILGAMHVILPHNSSLLLHQQLMVATSAVLVLLALQGVAVLELFLVTNMLCTCCFLPFLLGAWNVPMVQRSLTEAGLLLSIMASVAAVCIYGIASQSGKLPGRSALGDIWAGLYFAWMGNGYRWFSSCVWLIRLPNPSCAWLRRLPSRVVEPPPLPPYPRFCLSFSRRESTRVDVFDLPSSLPPSPSLPPSLPPPSNEHSWDFFALAAGCNGLVILGIGLLMPMADRPVSLLSASLERHPGDLPEKRPAGRRARGPSHVSLHCSGPCVCVCVRACVVSVCERECVLC